MRALLYAIFKYFFKEYFEFGSVSSFWIGQENNICAWFDSIQLVINRKYIPTKTTQTVKQFFQAKTLNTEKKKSYYQQYDVKRLK